MNKQKIYRDYTQIRIYKPVRRFHPGMRKQVFTLAIFAIALFSFTFFSWAVDIDIPTQGKWDFKPKLLWEKSDVGIDSIAKIQNLDIAEDGRIYIMDSGHFKTFILKPDGTYVSSFAGKGEGPNQIKRFFMWRQLFVRKNCVAFFDFQYIKYFSLEGVYLKSFRIPKEIVPRAFISDERFISAPVAFPDYSDPNKAELLLYDLKDHSTKKLQQYKTVSNEFKSLDGKHSTTTNFVFRGITPMMVIAYENEKIYYGKNDTYRINCIDEKGKQIQHYTLNNRTPKPISEKFKEKIKKDYSFLPKSDIKGILERLPVNYTFFDQIVVDRKGGVCVFISDPDAESSKAADIFSPDGKYIYSASIDVPTGTIIRTLLMKEDILLMEQENQDGEITLAKYSITRPVF